MTLERLRIEPFATCPGAPLDADTLARVDAWWRASCYLAAAMIHLADNPLLAEPLRPEHVKQRLLGHWGAAPGLAFVYAHVNRVIRDTGLDAIFLAGPGHGAPGVLAPVWLEGTWGEVYPDRGHDLEGLKRFLRDFSFPGGIGSHCTPELPGSIHEGGELGYVLSHATGAVFDHPELVAVAVVGDGEAETGPLATSWHSSKFLNPARDGAVLPVLHLNGWKIDNPTLLARIPRATLDQLLAGYGWEPLHVEGDDPAFMHQAMAAALDHALARIAAIRAEARAAGAARATAARWPMIVLRTPKGWTGPVAVGDRRVEGTWRSHQVPLAAARTDPAQLAALEAWLHTYRPAELFEPDGRPVSRLLDFAPKGAKRMSAQPVTNGGLVRRALRLPGLEDFALGVEGPGRERHSNTRPLGAFLGEVMARNPGQFRLFSPDEHSSNRLDAVYPTTGKTWLLPRRAEDEGAHLDPEGRVMEMLSEHTLEGWLEGYLLTGRHGLLSTYEAFAHVIDSMFNQHAKWLDHTRRTPWRAPLASLNLLVTSTVWRQDHNGFTHQDPGFLDIVANKSPDVVRIYLPPDANTLLVTAGHCLATTNRVNVIVCDKQPHLQYLDLEDARRHVAKGIGLFDFASTDQGAEPEIVLVGCGDIATQEALAAAALLREHVPDLRLRFVNVVDLFRLSSPEHHPHGLEDRDFDGLFTVDKPVLFAFHGYPWLIHRLVYRRRNHVNIHVRGYIERGSIATPLELAIANHIDRYTLAIHAIEMARGAAGASAHAKERLKDLRHDALVHAHAHGVDRDDVRGWTWPGGPRPRS